MQYLLNFFVLLSKFWRSLQASSLDEKVHQVQKQHFNSSATLGRGRSPTRNELLKVWQDSRTPSWDGDGALPVELVTYINACDFIDSMPLSCPLHSIAVEPDGHLTFEWYRHTRWILSVSISPERIVCYAGLFGNNEHKGAEKFVVQIPQIILDLIQRV
jgi:hypothetical protein